MPPPCPHPFGFLASAPRQERVLLALTLLRDALEAARDLGARAPEFAVAARELRAAGLTTTDLRWLVGKGYAQHLSGRGKPLPVGPPHFALTQGGRFVLTGAGLAFAREWLEGLPPLPGAAPRGAPARPRWDGEARRLFWGGSLVKHFRLPAANQETILAALEEQRWPRRIDDPLPGSRGIDPKARLHDTIKALNRHQVRPLLCFHGDGTGRGLLWDAAAGR